MAVRAHVWHPVDPGSSPGGVTTLSLRYSISSLKRASCSKCLTLNYLRDHNPYDLTNMTNVGILESSCCIIFGL